MKLSLDSLNKEDTGSSLTIDSLKGQETLPLGNDHSNTDRAAFASMAVGGDAVSFYQFFKDSLDINADDQPVKQSLQKVEQARQQRILGISGEMLIDPSVPDGVKATIPTYLQQQETPDARKIVAEQALFEDNGREGANQEAARSWVFNDIDAAIQYKKDASKYVSLMDAYLTRDYSYFNAWKDVFTELVPGVRAANVATIKEKVLASEGKEGSTSAVNFIGSFFKSFSNERDMRRLIEEKPPQERMDMLRKIVGIVQDQYGPGMFDNNEYAIIERARMLIADPETPFSDQGSVGAAITDAVFNALTVLGPTPKSLKAALRAGKESNKMTPKVVFSGGDNPLGLSSQKFDEIRDVPAYQRAAEKSASKDAGKPEVTTTTTGTLSSVEGVVESAANQVKVFDVAGTTMSESEIAQKRTELSALAENKFDRGTVKQLRSEQADLGDKIAQLEAEKLANKKNASQLAKDMKVSRKEAIRKANKVVDEQIDEYKARLSGIKSKLAYSERGYLAEAELSRFEQAVKAAKPVPAAKSGVDSAVRQALDEAAAHNVIGAVKPSSLVSTLAETNPTKASAFVKAAIDDETGTVAKVVSGTSRGELASDATSPAPAVSPVVRVKPVLDVDEGTLDLAVADSGVRYTDKELKSLRDNLKWSVLGARGVSLRTPMSQLIEDSDNGFRIKGLFTDGNVGFNDAQEAVERTMFALRNEGVGLDSLTVMKRTEKGYEPVEKGVDIASLPKGDYAVQVDHNWNFHLETGFEKFDIKRNWLDWGKGLFNGMVSMRQGSLTRHVFSPQQMFNKDLFLGVIPAFDKAAGITKRLANLADEFNKPYGKLSKKEQKELAEYIYKANVERIPFNAPEMIAAGFTHDQVNVMSNWKRYWDTAYVLENADKVRTLQLTGYKFFSHKQSGTELFVKPQGRNAPIVGKVYDPDTGLIVELSQAGKKSVYDGGGYVAQLRDHVTDASGESAKYVVVKNNVGSYARDFNENDRVLNYINGYYSVRHDAPLFVVQNVKDKSGRILYKKAVAEAGSIEEAEQMAKAIAARTQGHMYERSGHDSADFFIREDIKTKDALGLSEARFDVGISSGRSSQRFRGAPLESYDPLASGQSQYVQNPLEAMQQTAFSLGNRVATRPVIETLKARYMDQYADLLEVDPVTHMKGFPVDPADIGRNLTGSKRLTDARTMWEYINQLESGYESAIDVGTRSIIGIMADGVARIPVSPFKGKVEGALRSYAGSGKPTSTLKAAVYYSSLVSAHMGTFLMQSMQSFANLSDSFLNPKLYRDLSDMLGTSLGIASGESQKRGKQLWKEWERTGHSAAVDIHGAAFMGGAGSSRELGGLKASRPAKTAYGVMKFIQGFYNKGELVNQYTAWLAKRLDFEAANGYAPKTARELDQVHAEARNLTYSMNRAGQMPYNENTLNVSLQFFQVMHKAVFDPLFNRGLSIKDRARLTVAPLMVFGLPLGVRNHMNSTVESLPFSRDEKDKVQRAMEWSLMAKMLGSINPELGTLDFGKYNPLDVVGMADRLATLYTYPEMFTRNPAASLIDRGLTAAVTTSRYVGLSTADTGIEPNEEALWASLGALTAGTSNMFKGSMLIENGVFRDKYGRQLADEISPLHAYAQKYFAITPKEVLQTYEFNSKSIEINKQFKDDVATFIKNARQQLAMNGVLADSPEYAQRLMGAMVKGFKDNPAAMDELMNQLKYDMRMNGESSYLVSMMKASGWMEKEQLMELAVRIPDEKQRKAFLDMVEQLTSSGGE